jgi:hypothetical protein
MKKVFMSAFIILGAMVFMMQNALAKPPTPKPPKTAKFNAVSRLAHAGDVTGTLSCGESPAAGVFVYIPGTSFVAVTDEEGEFTLFNVPSNSADDPYRLLADMDFDPYTPGVELIDGGFTVSPKVLTDLQELEADCAVVAK